MMARLVIGLMYVFAWLPLPLLRALGWLLGQVLFVLVAPRRKVVLRNLELCFPEVAPARRKRWARQSFVYFCQTWMDRGWVWLRSPEVVRRRIRLDGALEHLGDTEDCGTILFTPHFYGLDAAGTRLALETTRTVTSIYTTQPNAGIDAWMKASRARFGDVHMLNRRDGIRPIVAALRKKGILFLLPDMNFGPEESIFVPFFGVAAATVPSLSRFAQLGRARVVPVVAQVTPTGYHVRMLPAWENFPSGDATADTARMNEQLEGWIREMPAQYFWVHKRFKTRPPGESPVY